MALGFSNFSGAKHPLESSAKTAKLRDANALTSSDLHGPSRERSRFRARFACNPTSDLGYRAARVHVARGDNAVNELFRIGPYRWLFASNLAFFLAMHSQAVVRGFLAFQLTSSEFALGAVSFAVATPMLLVSPIGGVLADRLDRRRVIMTAQALVLFSESTVLALYATDRLAFWHLVAAGLVIGSAMPLIMPARQAIVANLVDRERLAGAIALNIAGMNTSRVIGPALGGLLILGDDVRIAYAAGIAIYAGALLCMLKIEPARPPRGARDRSLWSNLAAGFAYLSQDRLVALLLLFGLLPMFLAMPFQLLLPAFADKVWSVGSNGLGLLSAVVGLGGVAGSLWIAWREDAGWRLGWQLVSLLAFCALLAGFCWTPRFGPALALLFLANVFASVFGTLNSTAIQLQIPDSMRGRVSSFLMMSYSLPLLGVLPVSYAAREIGVQLAVSGAAMLAALLGALFCALSPTLRGIDTALRRDRA
jgi:MFS family permease